MDRNANPWVYDLDRRPLILAGIPRQVRVACAESGAWFLTDERVFPHVLEALLDGEEVAVHPFDGQLERTGRARLVRDGETRYLQTWNE